MYLTCNFVKYQYPCGSLLKVITCESESNAYVTVNLLLFYCTYILLLLFLFKRIWVYVGCSYMEHKILLDMQKKKKKILWLCYIAAVNLSRSPSGEQLVASRNAYKKVGSENTHTYTQPWFENSSSEKKNSRSSSTLKRERTFVCYGMFKRNLFERAHKFYMLHSLSCSTSFSVV